MKRPVLYLYRVLCAAAAVLSICSFSACTKKTGEAASSEPATVVTATFYPLYVMLLNITENVPDTRITLLAPADTGCLHDYQLTAKDMSALTQCDILVLNGAGMESFLDKAVQARSGRNVIAADGYELIDDNPHIWVSPEGAAYETQRIAAALAEADPANADAYRRNAGVYIEKLRTLSKEMHQKLAPYAGRPVITFHEAFPYFATEFGFDTAAIIEREPGTEPTAKELLELIALVKTYAAAARKPVLFAEPQYSSSAAEVIASETGLTVYELDPAVTGPLDKDAYLDAMRRNLAVLLTAFGG
ncbi:metal ABC transporter substrate-binding protein [Treponema brennaborense]|uniref:ABC-type metal ion transporter, periplasmic subunit n=1 Tax=Treponema brennaborense (strain DSM 12168 / CIP 105900 / DD5/3) TaxID=906968 RepID=F4LQG0_TREBD|nr:metal ABC transporter substrate-binding protein [Treponema brennaborense]AEE17169.1 ABC-type metal ion transporter, periplasmic subunit [Treponema brennaborense DSM 12168]